MRPRFVLLCLLCVACGHSTPFENPGPPSQGPFSEALPRQLTFGDADDRDPAVVNGMIVFSRQDSENDPRERCLAFLPAEGGRLDRYACPPSRQFTTDTFLSTLVEPAWSPDGSEVAFMWVRGAFVSALSAWSHELVVAPAADPTRPRLIWDIAFRMPDGRLANALRKPSWVDGNVVRFLAAFEHIVKVKGGGAERFTDTALVSLGLMEMNLADGSLRVVPGAETAIAYTRAPDGGIWFARLVEPATLRHLAPGVDASTVVGVFSDSVADLALVDGRPVAAVGGRGIQWLDASGVPHDVPSPAGPVYRVAAVGGRRVIVEAEVTVKLFGDRANLWLLEIP